MASKLVKDTIGTSAVTVTLTGAGEFILVKSLDGGGIVHLSYDGTGAPVDADTSSEEDQWHLAAAAGDWLLIPVPNRDGTVVLSAEATADTVCAFYLVDRGYRD